MMKLLARIIRSITPVKLRMLIYRVGCFFGSSVCPAYQGIESTLNDLKRWGFSPAAVIDIGAYHGEWAKMFKAIFPSAKVLMVEGQDSKEPILRNVTHSFGAGEITYAMSLLGAKDGEVVQFAEMETGSSVYEESSPYCRNYIEKSLVTLDALVARYPGFERSNFIKIDVQGYELNVLSGAANLLGLVDFVLMEASLIPVNKGCPLISDVVQFMASRDFRMLDFCSQIRRKDGALWQTDLLFVRNSSTFVPTPYLDTQNWASS